MEARLLSGVSALAFTLWVPALDFVGPNGERGTFKLG